MSLITLVIIVLVLALLGVLPIFPHSRSWGYYPSGGLGTIIVIILARRPAPNRVVPVPGPGD